MKGHRDEDAIRAKTWPGTGARDHAGHDPHQLACTTSRAIGSDIEATDAFYSGLLGLRRVKKTANFDDPGPAHWYWGDATGRPGSLITYFERDANEGTARAASALQARRTTSRSPSGTRRRSSSGARRSRARRAARDAGDGPRLLSRASTPSDPDGHIVELATIGPGFASDEPVETLGQALKLPPWLERDRRAIEARLRPVTAPAVAAGGGGLMALHPDGAAPRPADSPGWRALGARTGGRHSSARPRRVGGEHPRADRAACARDGVTWLAPQAAGHTWCPNRFIAPIWSRTSRGSRSALEAVGDVVAQAAMASAPTSRLLLGGFSQGACLALEFVVRTPARYGAVAGLSGGLIGPSRHRCGRSRDPRRHARVPRVQRRGLSTSRRSA